MTPSSSWNEEYIEARGRLSAFVNHMANRTAHDLGFGWVPVPDAPDTYNWLKAAFKESKQHSKPLPVSSLFCDNTIYGTPHTNYAMRFWHDTKHIGTSLTFSLQDEIELGLKHLKDAEDAGIKKDSLEWQMLRVDMLGQNYLLGIAKRFPLNQERFVKGCLLYGLDEGVLIEARAETA